MLTPCLVVYAIDAKINIDDNASFRQQELFDQRDTNEDDPREVLAASHGLNYIAMEGNIGCMGESPFLLRLPFFSVAASWRLSFW